MAVSLTRDAERKHLGKTYRFICGIDEAGRGPLCGPVVAAACIFEDRGDPFLGVCDSKAVVKEEEREVVYERLTKDSRVVWSVGIIGPKQIDEMNILQATMLAMRIAAEGVFQKITLRKEKIKRTEVLGLVDGNRVPLDMPFNSQWIIKGDSSIFSIAAASIIAKVTRDRIMRDLAKKFPRYGLDQHKGYPTPTHRALLYLHGPCEIYRFSFGPVRIAAEHQARNASAAAKNTSFSAKGSAVRVASSSSKVPKVSSKKVQKIVSAVPVSGLRRSARLTGRLTE